MRIDVHTGDRKSFREQQKELVAFEAQETETYTQEVKATGNSRIGTVLQVAAGRGQKRWDRFILRADISVPREGAHEAPFVHKQRRDQGGAVGGERALGERVLIAY